MKNKDEELIQQLVEDQLKGIKDIDWSQGSQEDIGAYQILFQELSNETYVAIDFNIAEKVIRQISRKQHKAESIKYAFVILTISTVFILITSLSIMFVDPGFIEIIFSILTTHYEVFLFIILSLTVIQVLDKVFVKKNAQSIYV